MDDSIRRWLFPFTVAATVLNVGGIGYAAYTAEPMHAMVHGVIALGFGLWAARLRPARRERERIPERDARLEVLEAEVSDLQRELSETREGLDFAERLLAKRHEQQKPPSELS